VTRARQVAAFALGAAGLYMVGVALTVPMIVAAGPAVLATLCLVAAWMVFPHDA